VYGEAAAMVEVRHADAAGRHRGKPLPSSADELELRAPIPLALRVHGRGGRASAKSEHDTVNDSEWLR